MLALGLVIVYGILRLVNFAYGELIMVGGYTMYLLTFCPPLPWLAVVVLAVLAAMVTSLLTELVAFRPVREKSLTAMLITSFAVSTILQNGALLIISPRARAVTLPQIFQTSVMIAGTSVPWRHSLTIVPCIASVPPPIALPPLLVAFVATVIGGMRSLTGAVVGGFVYAIIISLLGVVLPPGLVEFREAFMFAFVIIILLFRPEGLIRSKTSVERGG